MLGITVRTSKAIIEGIGEVIAEGILKRFAAKLSKETASRILKGQHYKN